MPADLHAAFMRAAETAKANIRHEGSLPAVSGETLLQATDAATTLSVAIGARNVITRASHHGATDGTTRAVLDLFCDVLIGLPIQEAAEHGALRLLYRMREHGQGNPVAGIVTPNNVGGPFALAGRLIRAVFTAHREGKEREENCYVPPVSPQWKALTDDERLAMVEEFLVVFRETSNLSPEDLAARQIDRQVRVSFTVGARIPPADKSVLMRKLERSLRQSLGEELEAYVEEMRDQNKIRRPVTKVTKDSDEKSA